MEDEDDDGVEFLGVKDGIDLSVLKRKLESYMNHYPVKEDDSSKTRQL